MDFLKKNSNKIALSLGAAAVIVGGFMLFRQNSVTVIKPDGETVTLSTATPTSLPNQSVVFVKDDKYLTAVEKLKPVAQAELAGSGLTKQTIIQINQLVIYVFKEDYLRIFADGRRLRRKFIDSPELYLREFTKHSTEAEKLMENASLEVLRDLNISMDKYEQCCERIIQTDPQFAMFNLYMFESLKMQLPSSSPHAIDKEGLIKVLSCQAEQFQTTAFDSLNLPPQQLVALKQTYASDRAAMRYNFEDEDLLKNQALLQDPDVMMHHQKLQQLILGSAGDEFGF